MDEGEVDIGQFSLKKEELLYTLSNTESFKGVGVPVTE
jgi:hypothetical protein